LITPTICSGFSAKVESSAPDYANQYMSDLGLSGRQFYAVSQLTLDVLYPLLYGLLLSLSLALIYKNGLKTEHFLLWPPALPFTGTLADLCENFMIAFMLLTYPILSNWLVYVANLFTVVKWFAVTLSFMLIIFGAGRYFLTNLIHTRRK
jgi:hypothetical protein